MEERRGGITGNLSQGRRLTCLCLLNTRMMDRPGCSSFFYTGSEDLKSDPCACCWHQSFYC